MTRTALLIAAVLLAVGGSSPAFAEVEVAFYARDGDGRTFPHAFVTLHGTIGPSQKRVDRAVGFTAVQVSFDILSGPVPGKLVIEPPELIARSDRHFVVRLTDQRYQAVVGVIRRWKAARQPSYHLERRNCVHFVAELARASGLRVPAPRRYRRDPQAFLAAVKASNPSLHAQRQSLFVTAK